MRRVLLLLTVVALALTAREASAAPRFVERPDTLPKYVFAGDVGIGLGHSRYRAGPPPFDATGAGLNLEAAFGISDRVEMGFRTGIRIGEEGQRTQADNYGRTFWTETYGVQNDVVANPEIRVRWALLRARVVEIALDWRLYIPVEQQYISSRAGIMFGVPFAFHLGTVARIDTGIYLPVVFYSPTIYRGLSIPGYFWFNVTERVWLGPMVATRFLNPGPGPYDTDFLLGFGVGYQPSGAIDLKWQLFFPNLNRDGARTFGAGFGIQFRIGE